MLKKIGATLAVAVLGVLAFAATRPDTFRVERTITVKAPPAKILAHVNDFHAWSAWSPYEKLDPAMKKSYGGSPNGQGATYAWAGDKAGAGRMEIKDSAPTKIGIQLDFTKPMEGHNTAEFTFVPHGDTTTVTWAMYGPSPYMHKLAGVFLNLDHLIGKDFEDGLASLKAISET